MEGHCLRILRQLLALLRSDPSSRTQCRARRKRSAVALPWATWWLRWQRIHLQCRRHGLDPWVEKISWRRKWQPSPVFLPGDSHRQRSLAGYSPRGRKESDTTEQLSTSSTLQKLPSPSTQHICFCLLGQTSAPDHS